MALETWIKGFRTRMTAKTASQSPRQPRALRPVDLGRAIGLSAQQARRYERQEFLPPAQRSASGRRVYGERHLHAILAVRAMQAGYGWRTGGRVMRLLQRQDLAGALVLVDAAHAALHQRRREIEETLEALRHLAAADETGPSQPRRSGLRDAPLRVGDAAAAVGVPVSSLHFWEEQGLLAPRRDASSRYRLYDAGELLRLRIVVVLRRAGYKFEAIRSVLDELAGGKPGTALTAIERRRAELARASERCARATGAFWSYVSEVYGKPGPLSGSLRGT